MKIITPIRWWKELSIVKIKSRWFFLFFFADGLILNQKSKNHDGEEMIWVQLGAKFIFAVGERISKMLSVH